MIATPLTDGTLVPAPACLPLSGAGDADIPAACGVVTPADAASDAAPAFDCGGGPVILRARSWTERGGRPQPGRIVRRRGRPIDTTPPDDRELDDLMAAR